MAYFPFMIEIGGKDVLIVGGGRSAFHKVRAFLGFGAKITVIAENMISMKRAGANIIITYHALDVARWLAE